jgi:hypothetical protein|tara:strand:+ start:231 stop:485 length:255 start_codon:yes stop_codon:yes gene_type:complete
MTPKKTFGEISKDVAWTKEQWEELKTVRQRYSHLVQVLEDYDEALRAVERWIKDDFVGEDGWEWTLEHFHKITNGLTESNSRYP